MYKLIQSERLYKRIIEQVEQRIVSGELKVGDRLPPERELAEQFGVSRTAVREAVKALQEKGLVLVQPGRGTFITDSTSRAVRHSLGLMMRIGGPENSRNLVEVREILEPEIAALAAERASEDQIGSLRVAVETMDLSLDNVDNFIEADLDFHLALAEATQNFLIPTLIDSVIDLLRQERKNIFLFVNGGAARGQYHHKRILHAVIARDADKARAAMRAHLEQIRRDTDASASARL